jgi:polyhydroxyalkanoate synthesis regulator phasin
LFKFWVYHGYLVDLGQNRVKGKTAELDMDNNSILKQLLMLGVGTTSMMAERLKDVTDEWVKDGKINPEQATEFINELNNRFKLDQNSLESLIQRQIRNVMQDLGVARQNEMDELRGRIDRLERQMRDLENKNWR